MDKATLKFMVKGQALKMGGNPYFASNTVGYIEAEFDLHRGWDDFDSVSAIWSTPSALIATLLDSDDKCMVPSEVLTKKGEVLVSLVGTRSEESEVVERLTTYPVVAIIVDAAVPIRGTETAPITPSQFDQFMQHVDEIADSIPENVSELNNDAGYITENDLPTKVSDLDNDSGFVTASGLPSKTSDLTNDSGFITTSALPTNVSDLTNDSGFITAESLPVKVSELTNDSGYITSSSLPTKVSDLVNDSEFITLADLPIYDGSVS